MAAAPRRLRPASLRDARGISDLRGLRDAALGAPTAHARVAWHSVADPRPSSGGDAQWRLDAALGESRTPKQFDEEQWHFMHICSHAGPKDEEQSQMRRYCFEEQWRQLREGDKGTIRFRGTMWAEARDCVSVGLCQRAVARPQISGGDLPLRRGVHADCHRWSGQKLKLGPKALRSESPEVKSQTAAPSIPQASVVMPPTRLPSQIGRYIARGIRKARSKW